MNSFTTKGTGNIRKKNNTRLKQDKHYLHLLYGCNRTSCFNCFHGLPYQMYINLMKGK